VIVRLDLHENMRLVVDVCVFTILPRTKPLLRSGATRVSRSVTGDTTGLIKTDPPNRWPNARCRLTKGPRVREGVHDDSAEATADVGRLIPAILDQVFRKKNPRI